MQSFFKIILKFLLEKTSARLNLKIMHIGSGQSALPMTKGKRVAIPKDGKRTCSNKWAETQTEKLSSCRKIARNRNVSYTVGI